MHKTRSTSPSSSSSLSKTTNKSRFYLIILSIVIFLFIYWRYSSKSSSSSNVGLADLSNLPKSSLFTYLNISSQLHVSETQGILYVAPPDQPAHFASIKGQAVRGNHRHKGSENILTGEVLILLEGDFQFRIGDGDSNQYEDHQYDISKIGIVALKFSADKCHALKNIGKQTNWFASYYIKAKEFTTPPVDRQGCSRIKLV